MLKARFCQFYSVAYHITKIFFLPYKFYLQSLYRFILEIGVKRAVSQTFPSVQVLIRTLCFLVTTARTSAWPPNDRLLTRTTLSCLQSHLYLRLFWVRHLHHPLRTQRNWRSLFSHSFSWTWSRVAERKHDDLYTPIVSTIRIKPPKCLPFFLNKPLPGFWTRQVAGRTAFRSGSCVGSSVPSSSPNLKACSSSLYPDWQIISSFHWRLPFKINSNTTGTRCPWKLITVTLQPMVSFFLVILSKPILSALGDFPELSRLFFCFCGTEPLGLLFMCSWNGFALKIAQCSLSPQVAHSGFCGSRLFHTPSFTCGCCSVFSLALHLFFLSSGPMATGVASDNPNQAL